MVRNGTPTDVIWARNLELTGTVVTLGPSNASSELPAKPPKTDEPYLITSSPAERGLTDSEYKAAWALVDDINRYVEDGGEGLTDDCYLEPRWMDADGFVYRLRDGFLQSTIGIVKQSELDEYRKAVEKYHTNPYDAIGYARVPLTTEQALALEIANGRQTTEDTTTATKTTTE